MAQLLDGATVRFGDPLDRRGGLHQDDRVPERLQIPLQGTGPALIEPIGKAGRIGCRQLLVAAIGGQFHDRLGPQRTIEMLVKEDLGELFVQHPGRLSLEVGGPQALFIGRQ